MAALPRICVVGSANLDLTFRTPRLPKPGETLAGKSCHLCFGGKGANQAVAAARLGAHVAMVGKVGRDVFGEQILKNFQAEGIDAAHVIVADHAATGVAAIVVDDDARNSILVVLGANGCLSPDDVRRAADVIRSSSILLCQLEAPVEAAIEAFRLARAAGATTVLNPAPAAPLPDELLRLTDWCVPNETEAEALTGLPVSTWEEAADAAQALRRRGPATVIVTLGERGALLADARRTEAIPAVKITAIDPTGAGDAFLGALAVFTAEGMEMAAAIRKANRAAALSVTRPGTQPAFARREEVEAYLD